VTTGVRWHSVSTHLHCYSVLQCGTHTRDSSSYPSSSQSSSILPCGMAKKLLFLAVWHFTPEGYKNTNKNNQVCRQSSQSCLRQMLKSMRQMCASECRDEVPLGRWRSLFLRTETFRCNDRYQSSGCM